MKTGSLIAVALLSWAAGIWHVQVFLSNAAAAGVSAGELAAKNIAYLIYTAMLFGMPILGWLLRKRLPFWAVLIIAASPLLMIAATLRLSIT